MTSKCVLVNIKKTDYISANFSVVGDASLGLVMNTKEEQTLQMQIALAVIFLTKTW